MLRSCIALAAGASAVVHTHAQAAAAPASALFFENFQNGFGKFVKSSVYTEQAVAVEAASKNAGIPDDRGLVFQLAARHYAVGAQFPQPISITDKEFVAQYEVRMQEGLTCGGAYMKILNATSDLDISRAGPSSRYVIMFGPDRCGSTDKIHFIVRWVNPVTGVVEEKHLTNPPKPPSDTFSHLYTVVIRPDNTYAVKVDDATVKSGSLLSDFSPAILPPKQIDDPTDMKPVDWVDQAKIADPDARKPDDWDESAPEMIEDADAKKPAGWLDDEPEHIPDPSAQRPEGWDDEEDGTWEAPLVDNPKCAAAPGCGEWKRPMKKNPAYKGKWRAPMIDNPAYKGVWKPRQIDNPAYFEDEHVSRLGGSKMGGVLIEIWTMSGGLQFDNFLIGTSEQEASEFAQATWRAKHDAQAANETLAKRAADRQARTEAAAKGGWAEQLMYYAGEFQDLATDYPIAIASTLVVGILTLVGACFYFCAGTADLEPLPRGHEHGPMAAEDSDADEPDPHARPAARGKAASEPQAQSDHDGEQDDADVAGSAPGSEASSEAPVAEPAEAAENDGGDAASPPTSSSAARSGGARRRAKPSRE